MGNPSLRLSEVLSFLMKLSLKNNRQNTGSVTLETQELSLGYRYLSTQLPCCVPTPGTHFWLVHKTSRYGNFVFLGRNKHCCFLNTLYIPIVYAQGPKLNNETGMTLHACFFFISEVKKKKIAQKRKTSTVTYAKFPTQ